MAWVCVTQITFWSTPFMHSWYNALMNIRDFAAHHGVSAMTIRYYIEEGLLAPSKSNGKWNLDHEDAAAMADLLSCKACGFSLETIKRLLELKRSPTIEKCARESEIRELLLGERQRLHQEQRRLGEAIRLLDQENGCAPSPDKVVQSIPLRLFALIACPYCNLSLTWSAALILNNAVRHGTGNCSCGFSAVVKDGILHCPETPIIQRVDTNLETIRKRSAKDISILEKYFLWLFERLNRMDLSGKVMYEDVINLICFTAKAWPLLDTPPDIVLSDSLPEAVHYYAEALKAIHPDCGILPIIDDGVHHPLKRGCLDLVVDYCSSEIVQSYGYPSAVSLMHEYMKPNATVFGRFSHLHAESRDSRPIAAKTASSRYSLYMMKHSMAQNGIRIDEDLVGEEDLDASIYDRTKPGDIIRPYVFIGHEAVDSAWTEPSAN